MKTVMAPAKACATICLAGIAAGNPPSQAEGANSALAVLNRVTVIGEPVTSTAPGIEMARAEMERVPGGANVIGSDEYAEGRASNLVDMFSLAPGIFIQPRFGAEEARLSIRGSGLQRTFHMRGINLLQDGVPITLADGSGDFQAVEPLALAYTEVLRGANALEYGGTTLGGSINFVSPSGHDGNGFRPRLEGGSFGYRRALLSFGDDFSSGDYFASASAYEQDGFRAGSKQKNGRFFGNIALRANDSHESRFFLAAVNSDSQLPGALTKAQLQANPEQANAGNLAGRQKRDFELYRLANRTVVDLESGFIELTAGYSYKDLWHPIFQLLQQRSNDYNAGIRYVGARALGEFQNRLVVGLAPSWNRVSDNRFVNIAGGKGARTASSLQRSENLTVYAQNELGVREDLALIVGAQWSDSQRRYEDRFLTNGDQSLDASYTHWSPKLGMVWNPTAQWAVFANVSDSFEPPSFGELTGGPGVDLLDAQNARSVEIGTRGKIARVTLDLVAYNARVRDELLSLNSPTGQPLGTVNAPRTLHRGVELGADIALASFLNWRSSYLWNDFRFDDNASYGDNALPGIPEHFYRGELNWTPRANYFIALTTEWSANKYAVDMANTLFADEYAVWGVKVGQTVDKGLSWFVEGRNLSNRNYAATTGVIADARGLDSAQFYPGDGRAVYAGLSWRPR